MKRNIVLIKNNMSIINYVKKIQTKYDYIIISVISPLIKTRTYAKQTFKEKYFEIFVLLMSIFLPLLIDYIQNEAEACWPLLQNIQIMLNRRARRPVRDPARVGFHPYAKPKEAQEDL